MKRILAVAALATLAPSFSALADVQANWDTACAKCHGADGTGQTKIGKKLKIKDFTDAKVQAGFSDDEAFKAIREGRKDKDGKTLMKAIEGLSDADAKALVQHVRSLKK